ncbi:13457_t:CDS:2 [Funneliformis caledonium]|uniref:13457_t:CDS:1 n=1 Tax=Funneliformis caledonium TaxID=1117310 RepID=A0A9N8V9L2_9GLOM|nr:13457_t:CDS:2 [Funneliformis caledonium]
MIPLKENLRELGLGNSGLSMYIGSRIFAMFVIQYSDPITSVPRIIAINLSPFTAKSAMRTSRIYALITFLPRKFVNKTDKTKSVRRGIIYKTLVSYWNIFP